MNHRGHKRCSLPQRMDDWTSPHLPGKATGTSNMALSSLDLVRNSTGKCCACDRRANVSYPASSNVFFIECDK